MDQARHRFYQYLNRRYGQSTTPKCYASDLDIFLRSVGDKEPAAVTAMTNSILFLLSETEIYSSELPLLCYVRITKYKLLVEPCPPILVLTTVE
jgi:hypothetical protein